MYERMFTVMPVNRVSFTRDASGLASKAPETATAGLVRLMLIRGDQTHVNTRATRVQTPPIETRLGPAFGRLRNISATGALIRTDVPLQPGQHCPMFVNLSDTSISMSVRVVRSETMPPVRTSNTIPSDRTSSYLIAVRFTELSAPTRRAIETLCRPGRVERS